MISSNSSSVTMKAGGAVIGISAHVSSTAHAQ